MPAASPLARPPDHLRNDVKEALTAAPQFHGLDSEARRSIANSLVRIAHAAKLLEQEAGMPAAARAPSRTLSAGSELSGAAVSRVAGTTRAIIGAISFPRFVRELINGVFNAMVETNQQQLQQYVELTRAVSQSIDGFASLGGNDDAARRWLAEQFPQSYQIEEPDPEDVYPDEEPEPARLITTGTAPSEDALRAALGLEAGAEVPSGGAEALVPFVRRSLARNRQQILATMVQMGMQRIVVDSGRIQAGMRFHIDASSAAAEQNRSRFDTRTTIGARASGGFGIWRASASVDTTIGYVSATDRQTREELNASADLNSSVELHFRTDQVPLDRIASSQTVDRLRLNTLNPERELQIQQQTDQARIQAGQQVEQARLSRSPLQAAGQVQPAVENPPPAGRAAQGGGGQAGQQTRQTDAQPARPGGQADRPPPQGVERTTGQPQPQPQPQPSSTRTSAEPAPAPGSGAGGAAPLQPTGQPRQETPVRPPPPPPRTSS